MSPGRHVAENHRGPFAAMDRLFDRQYLQESPDVTPILFPLDFADEIIEHPRPSAPEPLTRHHSSEESGGPPTPPESIDIIWRNVWEAKERGFKTPKPGAPPAKTPPTRPKLTKKKSIANYKESQDGRTVTAVFDLPGIRKENMHVSFQPNRLTVTWRMVTVTEMEEGDVIVRERSEKQYSRTIPLPEDTKFEEVQATKEGGRLVLKYPNMKAIRVERRPAQPRRNSSGPGRSMDQVA